jgi:hypothetical protein
MGVRREDLFRYDKIAERLTRVGWRPDGAREIERIVTSLAACEGVDAEVQWPDGTTARYRVAAAQPFPRVVVGRLEPGISRPTFEAIGSEYNILHRFRDATITAVPRGNRTAD